MFADRLHPARLLRLSPTWPTRSIRCRVHRNAPFEHVAGTARPFLEFAGYDVAFEYSDYDDSLGLGAAEPRDLDVVWLDYDRYRQSQSAEELREWLGGRLRRLRRDSTAPILLNVPPVRDGSGGRDLHLESLPEGIAGLHLCDVEEIRRSLGDAFFDARVGAIGGWDLGREATALVAQRFGLVWLPAALQPRIKVVVLDLDNTLYEGVIGEDGVAGIAVSEEHRELHRALAGLASAGVFLAVASKNDPTDVERLWRERSDLGLAQADLAASVVGWGSKADAIATICSQLRVAPDSALLVDDNPGELASVAARHPGVALLLAESPEATRRALSMYPGLAGYATSATDALRLADARASLERTASMAGSDDPLAYVRSLQVRLACSLNPADLTHRLFELSAKTNQFNTGLLRLTEAEIARRLESGDHVTVAVALRDRLSDSGVIAALFATVRGGLLCLDEIDISCRALGRGVEELLIAASVERMLAETGCTEASFTCVEGPRNEPARVWFAGIARRGRARDDGSVEMRAGSLGADEASVADVEWSGGR